MRVKERMEDMHEGTPESRHQYIQGSRPKVTVSNVFGDINRGGAAITARTIRAALDLGADVAGISIDDKDPAVTHPHTTASFPDVPLLRAPLSVRPGPLPGARQVLLSLYYLARPRGRRLPEALRRVAASDVVVSKGGYVFVNRAGLRPLMRMWVTVYPLVFARRLGIPTVAFPTSISPQTNPASRLLNGWLLRGMAAVFPRDPLSADAARQLGVASERLHELPDIVLGSPQPAEDQTAALCDAYGVRPGRFAVMTIQLKDRGAKRPHELELLAQTGRKLLEHPDVDRILVVDQAGDPSDSADLAASIGEGARLVTDDRSPEDLIALYAGARVSVCCRLHAAIFSLIGGTPSVAVSVTPLKAEGVYATLGLPPTWVVTVDELDRLWDTVSSVLVAESPDRAAIRRAVADTAGTMTALTEALQQVVAKTA